MAPVFTWSGFYVGINAGYGFGKSSLDRRRSRHRQLQHQRLRWSAAPSATTCRPANWVWGLEGDIDWSNIKGSDAVGWRARCETSNTWLGTARGRIGYAFDRFLPYITGGAAFGNIKMASARRRRRPDETRFGWTLGRLAWNTAFLSSWSAKLEYLYVDLGTAKCNIAACGAGANVKFKTSIVRAGMNYRF